MPGSFPLTLVDALIVDLRTGALSIGVGLKIIEVLRDGGLYDAAQEIERRWARAVSPTDPLPEALAPHLLPPRPGRREP